MKIEVYSPTIRRKEMDAVLTAMVEEKIGPGDRNRLLIQTAKEHIKFDYALALRSPAVALQLALKTLDLKEGQGVLISALSPVYYLNVLDDMRLRPVYCDVSADFPCASRETIERALKEKPGEIEAGAVVLRHTLGFSPDAASIAELGFPVIEDVSQRAIRKEQGEGGSVLSILGLEERDMLTAGGGALLYSMNRKDSAQLRNYAQIADEYCLPDINAALAIVQLKEYARNAERRKDIANVYRQAGLRAKRKGFIFKHNYDEDDINLYSYSLVLETGFKDVIAYARKKDIILENAFEKTIAHEKSDINCPIASSLALRTVLFPMYPRLSAKDADRVSRLIMTLP